MKLKLLFMIIVCCVFNTTNGQNGDPSVFGNNIWNVYAYNGNDSTFPSYNYAGYYTDSSFSFDSETKWDRYYSPSGADGYVGNVVADDGHSYTAKRQGFALGFYTIDVPGHD